MEVDYIIVGAGSAGCVLANRLSEDAGTTVLLLEAGGEDRNPWIHIPAGYVKTMVNPAYNWMFSTEPEPSTGNREIPVPRGKVLGGSSAINGMVHVRGQRQDYDAWAQMGNTGWGFDDVLPYFQKMENREQPPFEGRGRGGPLNIADLTERYPVLDAVIRAAGELGYAENPDYNGARQDGISYFQVTQKDGRRMSANRAYLKSARGRPNLIVETHAFASRILFQGKRAAGVEYEKGRTRKRATARAEVILCAGAVQSPQLLEVSGIGDPDRLNEIGVPVIHAAPQVGENLQDHYIVRMSWRIKNAASLNQKARGIGLAGEVLRFALNRKGALTMPAGMLGGFLKSDPSLETPDVQYHIANASFDDPKKRVFHDFPGMTFGACQLRPESRGHIHARSAEMRDPPRIVQNFLTAPVDQRVIVRGLQMARDVMGTTVMRHYNDGEINPGDDCASENDLLNYARWTGATLYHPAGTCRMGIDPGAVVDPALRVNGVEGLRVVDASIMPRLISGNTNGPVIMIAEKAADLIRGRAALA